MEDLKRYSELSEEVKPIAMANYIKGYCAYTELYGDPTAEDIEENRLLFTPDGEIFGEYRVCDVCGEPMIQGYVYDGYKYYCSEKCLYTDFDEEGWYKECENNEESYWTHWY